MKVFADCFGPNHEARHPQEQDAREVAGIATEGPDKWKSIIQNSSLHLMAAGQRV